MNNHWKIKLIRRVQWKDIKLRRIRNLRKLGSRNYLKFKARIRKIKILENKSSRKINMTWRDKWTKSKARGKLRLGSNSNKLKKQRPTYRMKINSSSHMLKNVSSSGKAMAKASTPSLSISPKQWRTDFTLSLIFAIKVINEFWIVSLYI